MARVILTAPAKSDIKTAYDWWKEHRSAEQADRWYVGIRSAIKSLRNMPERCSLAAETDLLIPGIRQLLFGLGRRATHRIVFTIDGSTVIVLRVRHTSQDALSWDDLDL
jgi:plasmid stabilization system protein ParE